MAKYRYVYCEFWTDVDVIDKFSPEDRYFYLFLLTNPHTTQCGIYQISTKQMEVETGYNKDTVLTLINRFENEYDRIRYNEETREIAILNWIKYKDSTSDNTVKCVEKEFAEVKDRGLIEELRGYQGATKGLAYNKKKKKHKKKHKSKFYMGLFNHWNSIQIIIHLNLTDDIIKAFDKRLNDNTEIEIKESIDHYGVVIKDINYFFNYEWTLLNFLNRQKGMLDFLASGEKWLNYLTWKDTQKKKNPDYIRQKKEAQSTKKAEIYDKEQEQKKKDVAEFQKKKPKLNLTDEIYNKQVNSTKR